MSRKLVLPLFLLTLLLAACAQPQPTSTPESTQLPPEPVATAEATELALQQAPEVAEEQLTAEAADGPATAEPQTEPTIEAPAVPAADASDLISGEMLANMTYSSEFTAGGTAPLEDGEYREPAAPGSATETVVRFTHQVAYGELNGQPVAAVVLVSDPGGSGTFYSLHIVGLEEGEPVELASTFLGDRVDIDTLSVAANQVTVEMVVAGPQDPLCCPTQQVLQVYELHDGELQKTADEVVGSAAEAPAEGIVNRLWGWQERTQEGGDALPDIDPQKYTLVFHEDGSYQYTADCNRGGGLYTADSEGNVSLQPSVESMTDCGPGSHSEAMKEGLREARTYRRENGELSLISGDSAIVDTYIDSGTAVPEQSGLEIGAAQVSLDTQGLYETWTAVEIAARPVDDSSPPGPVGLPEHIQIYFDYDDPAGRDGGAIMYIIPVEAYIELWDLAGYDWIEKNINAIYEFARAPQDPPPTNGVPILPNEELIGVNDLAVQVDGTNAALESASQTGYRFIGRSAQDANPVTNQNLRYIYQGFTNDGKYLVAFFNPVRTDELADDPADVPQESMTALSEDIVGYLNREAQQLNNLPPDAWEPDVETLDALLNSLQIEGMKSSGLQDTTWEWSGQVNDPSGGEVTMNTLQGDYSTMYDQDLVLSYVADCNRGSSDYDLTSTGMIGSMRAYAAASTLADCGPGSFSQEFANMVGAAQEYRVLPGGREMILAMPDGRGDYVLREAEAALDQQAGAVQTPEGAAEVAANAGSTGELVESGITLDVTGLAKTYAWEVRPDSPIAEGAGGQGFPGHVLMTFDGENAQEVLADNGRRLYIFPVQPYIALYEAAGRSVVGDQVTRLQELIDTAQGRLAPPDGWMPLLPPPDSLIERWAQYRDYDFVNGMGVRYVGDSPDRESIGVWGNNTTGYYYQGLTEDGRYYVSLWWPVSTTALPQTPKDAPPEVQDMANNPETNARYVQETQNSLNALPPEAFIPSLTQLDVMLGSLAIGE